MKKYMLLCLLLCSVFLVSLGFAEGLSLHFLNVEDGDSIIVQCEGETLVIDGGESDKSNLLYSYLHKTLQITEVEAVLLTHPDKDHVGGLPAVFRVGNVKRVLSPMEDYDSKPFQSLRKAVEKAGLSIEVPQGELRFSLGSAEVHVYNPRGKYTDKNNSSLVTKISYKGVSALLMGDALMEVEAELMESGFPVRADLLKVGHHGKDDATSPLFLQTVHPDLAIVSGKKLPKDALIYSALSGKDTELYHTAFHGHIIAKSMGEGFAITVQKNAEKSALLATPKPISKQTEKWTVDNAPYIGNKNTKKFHYAGCSSVRDMNEKNKVPLGSAEEGRNRKFVPCKRCKP